jgi:uroporphyrinogen decarboxylase
LPNPIRSAQDVEKVIVPDIHETLGYVMDAIKLTKEMLNDEVPLIGFAGSPWTIFCYAVEVKALRVLILPKSFCFSQPEAARVTSEDYRYYHSLPERKSKSRCKCRTGV